MNFEILKREKGSITVYVLVALLFILAIIFGRYLLANRQLQTQLSALKQIKSLYESDVREFRNTHADIPIDDTSGENQGTGNIEIPTDDSNEIPIYNAETLLYFLSENGPYYIYQEGKNYVNSSSKEFKLMHDIKLNSFRNDIVVQRGYNKYQFNGAYSSLNSDKLNFNKYVIFTADGYVIFYYNNAIRVRRV